MNTAENRRYRDNDDLLKMTMLDLLSKHGFEEITVTRLCRAAGCHRSTFYAHFKDIDDLMVSMLGRLRGELEEKYRTEGVSGGRLRDSIEIYQDHAFFYKVFYGTRVRAFQSGRRPFIWERFLQALCDGAGIGPEYERLYADFFCAGLIALIRQWLASDCAMETGRLAALIVDLIPASLLGGSRSAW